MNRMSGMDNIKPGNETTGVELTEHGFLELCREEIAKQIPGATLKEAEDKWSYTIELEGDESNTMGIFLGNTWENYQRTKDFGAVAHFINLQRTLYDNVQGLAKNGVDLSIVYPTFRQTSFGTNSKTQDKMDEKNVAMVQDSYSEALKVFYIQDHPDFVSFVISNMIPENMTEDELSEQAFNNLKALGWTEPVETIDLDIAKVHIFHDNNKQYQAQFMVKEMYLPHLGDYFWFSLPTRDTAIAVQWMVNPDDHMEAATAIAMNMKNQSASMFSELPNPLSHIIHSVQPGRVVLLG